MRKNRNNTKVLAIIPARSGSKGIPMKNIRELNGKPLLAYTILAAKKSKLIDRVIVSTDSQKIAKIARKYGVEVPFLRPKLISTDRTPMMTVIKHSLDLLQDTDYMPDIIIILQPTSPLRSAALIDKSIRLLRKSDATCVIAVSKVKTHPFSSFWYKNKELIPFIKNFKKFYQRQQYPTLYFPTGSIYTFWNNTIKKYNSIYGNKILPIFVEDESIVDIDTMLDLFISEMIMSNWKQFKTKNKF